jgi:tripartite-type tricarboxylate transporter receptor subunit TctC
VGCLGTASIATSTGGSSSANEFKAEAAENPGKRFRVIVPCHDGAGWDIPRIEAGQEKELSVP